MGASRPGLALQHRGGARLKGLRAGHVAELVRELTPLLEGLTVRDIDSRPPRDLILVFEGESPITRLRLSADPDAPRLHLAQGRGGAHPGPVGPFFRGLTERLVGATLRRIEQVGGDRIVLIEFQGTGFQGTGEPRRLALVLELVGRHSNLILLGKGDEVLDILVPPP
ncbi:MAG: NFACT family protein, partial [Planctomycetota bacterium]|nr:NFACT family protein [Planctomycetota bacterium]